VIESLSTQLPTSSLVPLNKKKHPSSTQENDDGQITSNEHVLKRLVRSVLVE
jgi:hypothetical protein